VVAGELPQLLLVPPQELSARLDALSTTLQVGGCGRGARLQCVCTRGCGGVACVRAHQQHRTTH
jgi:hypothetical protein